MESNLFSIVPNDYDAKIVKNLYSGDYGETYQFLQIQYFSYVLSNFENEFYEEIYSIAQDDKQHHELLAEIILKLGGDPTYEIDNEFILLRNIEYFKGIKQILSYILNIKENAIIKYKILLNKIEKKE